MIDDKSLEQDRKNQPLKKKSTLFKFFVAVFLIMGVFGILGGLILLLGAFSSGFTGEGVSDAIFNFVFGILFFVCSRVLAKGKVLAIWILGVGVMLSMIYSFTMGRGFNFVIAAAGTLSIWQLLKLKKSGELT